MILRSIAIMLFSLSVMGASAAQESPPEQVTEATRIENINAYVKRTRGWGDGDFKAIRRSPREGIEHIPIYYIQPNEAFRSETLIPGDFEILLDAVSGHVIGERVLRRSETLEGR